MLKQGGDEGRVGALAISTMRKGNCINKGDIRKRMENGRIKGRHVKINSKDSG